MLVCLGPKITFYNFDKCLSELVVCVSVNKRIQRRVDISHPEENCVQIRWDPFRCPGVRVKHNIERQPANQITA